MPPLVFLDCDGVVNSRAFFATLKGPWDARSDDPKEVAKMIDPAAVARLNRIVRATRAMFVISSSWRIAYKHSTIWRALRVHGFEGVVVGATPTLGSFDRQRGDEIKAWLLAHPEHGRYAILDDDADMRGVQEHLVKTTFELGITDEHVDLAIGMLLEKEAA